MDKDEIAAKVLFVKALNKVQGLLEPLKKEKTNSHFGNKYADLEAVMEAIRGPLTENGFVVLQGGAQVNGKACLRTTLVHSGGYEVSFDYPLIEDTSNPQKVASATTYARRYALAALVGLSMHDDDGNTAAGVGSTAPAKSAPAPKSESNANGHEVHTFVPAIVTSKSGTGKKGPWKSYAVKLPSGDFASTFDEGQGKVLTDAKAANKQVRVSVIKQGEYKNIAMAEMVPATEDEPVYEEAPF